MEDVNIAAELYISNKQHDKALEVREFTYVRVTFWTDFCSVEENNRCFSIKTINRI